MRLLVLFALAGCSTSWEDLGVIYDTGIAPREEIDADLDGWLEADDCDDQDASVHPGAEEVCDESDNDCNGVVDDNATDASTWWPDADEDGHGDLDGASVDACEAPAGYLGGEPTDCNDARDDVSPDAPELCDNADNDCDGETDEDAIDPSTWFADDDGDGYGDSTDTIDACDAPSGYVGLANDCDDARDDVFPGAAETDCLDATDYNCDGSVGYVDEDGDGWAACEECNDTNAETNPGAVEICDVVDNNCDGAVDEGAIDALTWYADADVDGHGDATVSETTCDQPTGYVDVGDDCDDADASYHPGATETCSDLYDYNCDGSAGGEDADNDGYAACDECDDGDAAVHPGATETCNDQDDDCDGTTDEADATDAATWYIDGDGDGYGDAGTTTVACDAPAGYAATDDDCDDGDAAYNPGADESDCDDPADYNCDGSVAYADADGDGFSACTECDDTDPLVNPGAIEACNDVDDDCDGDTDEASASDASTWYADADHDSYGDAASTTVACDVPSGYVANDDDCDDAAATTYPSAAEVCDGDDQDCDGTADEGATDATTWYTDGDGDAYGLASSATAACSAPTASSVAVSGDCDDGAAAVHPGATETCNDTDDDCDGAVDDNATDVSTWYADADVDGYGDLATSQAACDQPSGYVVDATDCNDGDNTISPAAVESCDGEDDDCDGVTDEGVGSTWYADLDGDGFGDASASMSACTEPADYVADATDCNDGDATVSPGEVESCNSVDDDCDGSTDEGVGSTWYADLDGDTYGDAASSQSACSQPTDYVSDATDCDDGEAAAYPGATETCDDGLDNDCDPDPSVCRYAGAESLTAGTYWLGTANYDYVGSAVAGGEDVDGDGLDDVLIGGYNRDTAGNNYGAAYVVTAPGTGSLALSAADYAYFGPSNGSLFGVAVALAPDVDGDGHADVVVGASTGRGGTGGSGLAYLFTDAAASVSSSAADVSVQCDNNGDACGNAVAASEDFNDDGLGDFVVAAYTDDPSSGTDAGRVAIIWSSALSTSMSHTDASIVIEGAAAGDKLGTSVSGVGDLNGDGLGDVAIGAPYYNGSSLSDSGGVFIVLGTTLAGTLAAGDVDAVISGVTATDYLGKSLAGLGDADGDGYGELAVGADYSNLGAADSGAVYVFEGASTGTATALASSVFTGAAASDYAGRSVAGPGDVDADGFPDLLIGATATDTAASGAGTIYLFYGALPTGTVSVSTADAMWHGAAASDAAGYALGRAGDVDGDGADELLFGMIAYDGGGTDAGGAFLVRGTTE